MADKYYRGENINITLEMYDNDSLEQKKDLSGKEVDMLLYSYTNRAAITASTDESSKTSDIVIERVDDYTLKVVFSSEMTLRLAPGGARVEIKIRDNEDDSVIITTSDSIIIEESLISNFI